jgi:hypothetical protein
MAFSAVFLAANRKRNLHMRIFYSNCCTAASYRKAAPMTHNTVGRLSTWGELAGIRGKKLAKFHPS